MTPLLQLLASELEKPRPLPPQVGKHLAGTYGISRDGVSEFLIEKLPALEDYEIDLVLSPAFTPSLTDQAIVADHLGQESVPESEWPGLISELAARPTRAVLLGEDQAPVIVPLREVTLERYVHRLRLQGTIPAPLFNLIGSLAKHQGADSQSATTPPGGSAADGMSAIHNGTDEQPLLKAIARRAIWGMESRLEILFRFLGRVGDTTRAADTVALLALVETYQPADTAEILRRLPHWQEVLRHELGMASGPKPFFNERVQELHGGGRDQRRTEETRVGAKQRELDFLLRLQALLDS